MFGSFSATTYLNANSWSNNCQHGVLPRQSCAGICSAAPSAVQSSRTNFSSLLTIRDSALIFQARRVQIPSSLPLSAVVTLALFARPGFDGCRESARGRVSYITRAHPLARHALLLPRLPRLASPFPFNVIPAAMISPVASTLFASSLYPTAIGNGLQHNAVNTTASAFNVDQGDLKIDLQGHRKGQYFLSLHQGLSEQSIAPTHRCCCPTPSQLRPFTTRLATGRARSAATL